jgi:hypothetical protein
MGPFEWLAGRWTPEFEYRDRLADEVEDIAFESTRIGTRRGFLMGILVGAIVALIGIAALRIGGLETRPSPPAAAPERPEQATASQPSSDELALLRQQNEQLKEELARAKAAEAIALREKRVAEPSPSHAKKEVGAARPSKPAPADAAVTPRAKSSPPRSSVAQPIPSNCRTDGVCDSTNP